MTASPANFAASSPAGTSGTLELTWDEDAGHAGYLLAVDGGAAVDITDDVVIFGGECIYALIGLDNGVGVALSLVAKDADDNESTAATIESATPVNLLPPTISGWEVSTDGLAITGTLSQTGCSGTSPDGFVVTIPGGAVTVSEWSIAEITITITLEAAIEQNDTVTISYSAAAGLITSGQAVALADITDAAVTNNSTVDSVSPTIIEQYDGKIGRVNTAGTGIEITFSEEVVGVEESEWTVTVDDEEIAITSVVSLGDNAYRLVLASVITLGQEVLLDGGTAVEDLAGNGLTIEESEILNSSTVVEQTSGYLNSVSVIDTTKRTNNIFAGFRFVNSGSDNNKANSFEIDRTVYTSGYNQITGQPNYNEIRSLDIGTDSINNEISVSYIQGNGTISRIIYTKNE